MLGETSSPGNVSSIYSQASTPGGSQASTPGGSEANEVANLTPMNAQNYRSTFTYNYNALAEFPNRPSTGTPRPPNAPAICSKSVYLGSIE
jgi:hypothetical protein